jgi:4-hydroxybenzoate polyprenyltransferase
MVTESMESASTPANAGGLPSPRVLGRVDNWWYSKVAPAIAISYCAALLYRVPAWATARSILLIAFVGLCAGSYGHLINDVFDIEVDRSAGKRNHMAKFTPLQRFLLCAVSLALGFAPALFVSYSSTSLWLLAFEFLLPTVYSVPPLRLKGRGALGLLCDSLGAHTVPCLYVISVLAHQSPDPALTRTGSSIAFVCCTAVWALFLGLIGILIHEFEDRDNDLRSGIRTFATEVKFRSVRPYMTVFYAIELCTFAAMAALLGRAAPLVAIAAVLFIAATSIKLAAHWHHYRHYEQDSTAIQWWQLSHPFYEGFLPLAAAIQCAWLYPVLGAFPVLQLAIFAPTFRKQAAELNDVLRQSIAWILWGGRLDVDPSARAWTWPLFLPRLGIRVAVKQSGFALWNIRLARPGLKLCEGAQYQIRFKIRASRTRTIMFGVWQDHDPWEGVGYCEELEVSREWQTVWRTFTANSHDRHTYFGFWLGGEHGSVDIWRCSVRPCAKKDSVP